MRFVFGYLGIPSSIFDSIEKRKTELVTGKESEPVLIALKASEAQIGRRHISRLQEIFKEKTINEFHGTNSGGNHISNIGFAVIYINGDSETSDLIDSAFFPSTLVLSINWSLTGINNNELNKSKNELVCLLSDATKRGRIALNAIGREVTEKRNRTPLLLPIKNFHSKKLQYLLTMLQERLAGLQDLTEKAAMEIVREIVKSFESKHPLIKIDAKQPCFLDTRNVEFHPPGTALHGLPRPTEDHPITCFLGGYRRLGAPFHAAFHYDCMRGERKKLRDSFHSCHAEPSTIEGSPHLNIAPNDFVRM
jgi:hypothetical protein